MTLKARDPIVEVRVDVGIWGVGSKDDTRLSPLSGTQRSLSPTAAMHLRRPPWDLDLRQECPRFLIKKHLLCGVADIFFFSYLKTRKRRMNFNLLR